MSIEDRAMSVNRRGFFKISSALMGGILLEIHLPLVANADNGKPALATAFVEILADKSIQIYATSPEIGQGVKTSLPMIVAEEMDADWGDVRVRQSAIDKPTYGRQEAGGSESVRASWDMLREAGATVRLMLLRAAAQQWRVLPDTCATEAGYVVHSTSGRRLHYGDLAIAAASQAVPAKNELHFKEKADYRILGKRITGVDNFGIVTGAPLFGIDQKLPGMLYACYEKSPALGGTVVSSNIDEIKKLNGVVDAFVLDGNGNSEELAAGVAVVGNSTWAVLKAKRQLKIRWDESQLVPSSWSQDQLTAKEMMKRPGTQTVTNKGDVDAAFVDAAVVIEGFYQTPFLPHAPLEPQNATAWYKDDEIEIWAPTQAPHDAVRFAATIFDVPASSITLHQLRAGGGFGRRLMNDFVFEAIAISQKMGAPIKLQWTREDDMAHDCYRVGGFHGLKGAIDKDGRISGWQDHFVTYTTDAKKPARGANLNSREFPLALLDNAKATSSSLPVALRSGWWRAPGSNALAFVMQSFIHELSVAAKRDHLAFLLELMGEPRWLDPGNTRSLNTGRASEVIKRAAQEIDWGKSRLSGQGLGLAFHFSHRGHFAVAADLSVDEQKHVTINRIVVAGDAGPVINLSGAEHQCKGSVIDALSTLAALQVSFENGSIIESNFHQYPLLTMKQTPPIEVHFIESDFSPTGMGEPAFPPVAPAVCNAIFQACGERIRELPISNSGFTI
ncbi:MAG: molybdopterin cofactor-binding domain-containing protein [Pseudomonadales bacterium]